MVERTRPQLEAAVKQAKENGIIDREQVAGAKSAAYAFPTSKRPSTFEERIRPNCK